MTGAGPGDHTLVEPPQLARVTPERLALLSDEARLGETPFEKPIRLSSAGGARGLWVRGPT